MRTPDEPALTFVFVAAVMFGPSNAYKTIERVTITLIVVMLVLPTGLMGIFGSGGGFDLRRLWKSKETSR